MIWYFQHYQFYILGLLLYIVIGVNVLLLQVIDADPVIFSFLVVPFGFQIQPST